MDRDQAPRNVETSRSILFDNQDHCFLENWLYCTQFVQLKEGIKVLSKTKLSQDFGKALYTKQNTKHSRIQTALHSNFNFVHQYVDSISFLKGNRQKHS